MKKLVSKSQFSRMAGVTPAAVTKACNGKLGEALDGKRIDVEHASAQEYLTTMSGHRTNNTLSEQNKNKKTHKDNDVNESSEPSPEDLHTFSDMTLRELIEKFGTDTRFVDWLNAVQKIESINEKRLKNARTEGELVNRHLIQIGVIEPIDSAHVKLLSDGAKTIAVRTKAMVESKCNLVELETFVSEQISSFIRPLKAKVARGINNA